MVRLEKLKKEEELYANPKTKIFGLMLKAKRMRDAKEAEKKAQELEE